MTTAVRARSWLLLLLLPCSVQCRSHSARGSVSAKQSVGSASVLRTTVCAIAANPKAFYGKRVTVEGCVTTDGIEHSVLGDKACPYTGIGPAESVKLRPAERFFPQVDKQVCGTFTGVFQATRSIGSIVVDANVLEIEETAHLKTLPIDTTSTHRTP
jgi:hypothetical protein